jgi:hypothetical protein
VAADGVVTWRQHRPTLISVPALLGAVAVFLLIAGLKVHHDYAVLTACHPAASTACQHLNSDFNSTDWTMATLGVYLGLALLTWQFLRRHYLPAPVTSNPAIVTGRLTPNTPWVLSTWHTGPGGRTQWWSYRPVSRFWPLQFAEGGWLLVLSVILIAATVWLVRRRAA